MSSEPTLLSVSVPSLHKPGDQHTVERGPDGILRCTCPRFSFGSFALRRCSHTDIVEAAERLALKCRDAHAVEGGGVCFACLVSMMALSMRKLKLEYEPKRERMTLSSREEEFVKQVGDGNNPEVVAFRLGYLKKGYGARLMKQKRIIKALAEKKP